MECSCLKYCYLTIGYKKTNSKYLIGIKFDKAIRPFVLIMPEMSGYIKIFKVKDRDKHKNNILMSFHIDNEKLLE